MANHHPSAHASAAMRSIIEASARSGFKRRRGCRPEQINRPNWRCVWEDYGIDPSEYPHWVDRRDASHICVPQDDDLPKSFAIDESRACDGSTPYMQIDYAMTLEEIGQEMHLTRERVRQIEEVALGRLALMLDALMQGRPLTRPPNVCDAKAAIRAAKYRNVATILADLSSVEK